jgi:hypothetical protein
MNSKILDTFISGVELFNKGETLAGHAKWESLWKVGDLEIRKWIKGWLQFSGSILNVFAKKREGAIYLAGKSINNLSDEGISSSIVDVDLAITDMSNLREILKNDSYPLEDTNVIARVIKIKLISFKYKRGVDFLMTSEH